MKGSVRFVFEVGDPRVEELDYEGNIVKELHADKGTVQMLFCAYNKMTDIPDTIALLEEALTD